MYENNYLFNSEWTQGSLSAISPFVYWLGTICMIIISLGGFFMVIMPIIRNVINGIVCVAPNLCERIKEAHETKLGLNKEAGGNQIQMIVGSGLTVLLSLCPNFIALSDFDKGIQDPGSYMLKALPLMCIYVFIGVFIFYGYPSKFAEKFSDGAIYFIDMVLNNVDPEAIIEKIPTMLARPDFATNNATDLFGKNVNKVSKALQQSLVTKYNAMSGDNRTSVSREVEAYVDSMLAQIEDKSNATGYTMSVNVRTTDYPPNIPDDVVFPNGSYDESEHMFVYHIKDLVSNFSIDVPGGVEGDYFLITLKFYEKSDDSTTLMNVQHTLTIKDSEVKGGQSSCEWIETTGKFTISDSITINGHKATKVKKNSNKTGDTYTVTFDCTKEELFGSGGAVEASGITVNDSSRTGAGHKAVKVQLGSDYLCTPIDTSRFTSWKPGESPQMIGEQEKNEQNNSSTSSAQTNTN